MRDSCAIQQRGNIERFARRKSRLEAYVEESTSIAMVHISKIPYTFYCKGYSCKLKYRLGVS